MDLRGRCVRLVPRYRLFPRKVLARNQAVNFARLPAEPPSDEKTRQAEHQRQGGSGNVKGKREAVPGDIRLEAGKGENTQNSYQDENAASRGTPPDRTLKPIRRPSRLFSHDPVKGFVSGLLWSAFIGLPVDGRTRCQWSVVASGVVALRHFSGVVLEFFGTILQVTDGRPLSRLS